MRPGDIVGGRFELEALAGTGAMGALYRARDRETGGPVAIKVILHTSEEGALRFERESKVLASLDHPAVVRYVAHGSLPSREPFLAMEWLDGEDLASRLARGPLTLADALALVTRVADAMGYAHAVGVVHRDLKPQNLFLPGGDIARVKVVDFGLARVSLATGPVATGVGQLLGTPGYMAPEQVLGREDIDARADVFALGCVLYECVTHRPAFWGESLLGILAKITLEHPPRLRALRRDVPRALDDLVNRMLAKKPAERPEGGAAVAEELRRLAPLASGRASSIPARASLTELEQHLVSVVVAAGDRWVDGGTLATALSEEDVDTLHPLRAKAAAFGAQVELLVDGTVVATISGQGVATDQAAAAARCALALQQHLTTPVVLASGRALVSDHLPFGEAIDRAVRLVAVAPPAPRGGARPIRVDEVTAGLLDERFDVRGDGQGLLLFGEREVAREGRTLLGHATPCVGRERELAALVAVFEPSVAERKPGAVVVTGPAGVGKSRLLHELVREIGLRGDRTAVWFGRGDPLRAGSPFAMLAPALRRAAGVLDGEPLATRQQKLHARVARHVAPSEVARVAEFLGELIGAPFPDDASVQLAAARRDPRLMGDQITRAWEDFLAAECAQAPVLVVFEDLHWGDLPSVELMDAALSSLQGLPLMALALARPEVDQVFPALWSRHAPTRVELGPLSREASELLVHEVLGADVAPDAVARLVDRAGGNAFYLEGLIRAVAEGKGDALPETVRAMVHAGLERLAPEVRPVLRAASVFGLAFWDEGVEALMGGEEGVRVALEALVAREVVALRDRSRFADRREYTFRHALVREGAYAMLTDADRALGHRLAGEWLEAAGEPDALVLAEHFERGGVPERAASWYRQAATQALEGNDLGAALSRAERGIACGAEGELLGSLQQLILEARQWRGEWDEVEAVGPEALARLRPGSVDWVRAVGRLISAHGALGKREELAARIDLLCATPVDDAACGTQLHALTSASVNLRYVGLHDRAHALAQWIEQAGPPLAEGDPVAAASLAQARAYDRLFAGDPGAFLRFSEAALAALERVGNRRAACQQRVAIGDAYKELGLYREAEATLRAALGEAERMRLPTMSAMAKQNLGMALALRGALEEARACLEEARAVFSAQRDPRTLGGTDVYLARILDMAGQHAAAKELARSALLAARGRAEPNETRACALAALAHAGLALGEVAEAQAAAREAAAVLTALGHMEEGEGFVRLVLAESLQAAGDRDGARQAIAYARERLLARAEAIEDPALRSSFLNNVPDHARTLTLARQWAGTG